MSPDTVSYMWIYGYRGGKAFRFTVGMTNVGLSVILDGNRYGVL